MATNTREYMQEWHSTHPGLRRAYSQRWRDKNPFYHRAHHRAKRYGLSPEEQVAVLAQNDGMCALCLVAPATDIDHDHESGRVRGALCRRCNLGIGMLRDDPALLMAAVEYLKGRPNG